MASGLRNFHKSLTIRSRVNQFYKDFDPDKNAYLSTLNLSSTSNSHNKSPSSSRPLLERSISTKSVIMKGVTVRTPEPVLVPEVAAAAASSVVVLNEELGSVGKTGVKVEKSNESKLVSGGEGSGGGVVVVDVLNDETTTKSPELFSIPVTSSIVNGLSCRSCKSTTGVGSSNRSISRGENNTPVNGTDIIFDIILDYYWVIFLFLGVGIVVLKGYISRNIYNNNLTINLVK